MLPLPQEYLGSLCEIKTLNNDLLAVGEIIKIDHEALEVAAKAGERMPLLQYRSVIKMTVHHAKLGIQTMAGIVFLSTENFMRADEVKTLSQFERRDAFRVNIDRPGKLYPVLSEEEQNKFDQELYEMTPEEATAALDAMAIEVRVLDVSLTGVRIQPTVPIMERAQYILEFSPLETPMRCNLNVRRKFKNHHDELQYGCSFFGIRQRQQDRLCKDLFQLQREEKSKHQSNAF